MSAKTEKKLNSLQNWFLRLLLQVGPGAPLTALTWESGCLDMGLRVALEKISMVMHLRSLDESSLARRIYEEQKARKWPGLAKETSSLCNKLEVEDCNTTRLGKNEYRKLFIEACRIKHEAKMKDDGSKLVKC